jgi:hypothetical protein
MVALIGHLAKANSHWKEAEGRKTLGHFSWHGVDLSRSGSRQDFRPIRFNLKPQTLASFGYGGVAPHASLSGWKQSFVGRTRRTISCRFPAESPPQAAIRRECSGPARPS